MLTWAIVVFAAVLLGLKIFAPQRLLMLGQRLERVVNAILIALGLVYLVQVGVWLLAR